MNISLPKSAIEKLPAPDDQGLVRVMIAMKVEEGGEADIVEVNGSPVPSGRDDAEEETGEEDSGPMKAMTGAEAAMPSPEEVGNSMY